MNLDERPISLPEGYREFGPFSVPDGYSAVQLILARKTTATPTYWDDGVTVNLDSWCSVDGGVTWLQWLGFRGEGGIHVTRLGAEAPVTSASSALPEGTNRQIRIALTISGGQLVSVLTVEVT